MKKVLIIIGFLIMMLMVNFTFGDVTIIIDEEIVDFTEEYGFPFIDVNYRTQVPLRTALEYFGAEVGWVQETRTATVIYKDKFIEVPIGKKYIIVNGVTIENDTAAIIRNERTYLPLRVVFESFGAYVSWDSNRRYVLVTKEDDFLIENGTEIGQRATNIEAIDQFNQSISLEALLGDKVILTFYTTW